MNESPKTTEEAFQKLQLAWRRMLKDIAEELGIYKMLNWLARLLRRSQKG